MPGFGERVLDEGAMRLVGFRHIEYGLRQHFKIKLCQQGRKLTQFAGIAGG